MSDPKVSIVTPSYNMAPYLERTIRSVLCQDYANIEYILLDSCSKDGTREILDRYAHAIDVLIVEKDKGQTDALNRGLGLATGDILGYLNADDCLAGPGTISSVVRQFQERPGADALSGHRNFIDRNGEFVLRYPMRPMSEHILKRACYIAQEATFWRREIYERVGGYMDVHFDFAMDYELWMRFLAAGARIEMVPEVWGLFRWYPDQKSRAIWETKGLPEIARLHEKYVGRRIGEEEMYDYHSEYMFGVAPREYPRAYQFYQNFWNDMISLAREQLSGMRLDAWVLESPLNRTRVRRQDWARAQKAVKAVPGPKEEGPEPAQRKQTATAVSGIRKPQPCPVCGRGDSVTADDRGRRSLQICPTCRHIFWDRNPPAKQLVSHYKTEYCVADGQPAIQERARGYYRFHVGELLERIGRSAEEVCFVDYGSSVPVMVEEARNLGVGRAIAVEYADAAAVYAKERGLEFLTPEEFDATIRPFSVHVIRFSAVLQHSPDPAAILATAVRKLRPGGLLYIMQPNYPVFKPGPLPRTLPGTVYPTHLQFFSPLSLLALLSSLSLRVVTFSTECEAEKRYFEYRELIDLLTATEGLESLKDLGEARRGREANYPFYAGDFSVVYAIKEVVN